MNWANSQESHANPPYRQESELCTAWDAGYDEGRIDGAVAAYRHLCPQQKIAPSDGSETEDEKTNRKLADWYRKQLRECQTDLLAARNKNNDDGIEIARLLAELKATQENLTAMIDEALRKSKRLDEVEKEMRDYRKELVELRLYLDQEGYTQRVRWIKETLDKYPSPTYIPDK